MWTSKKALPRRRLRPLSPALPALHPGSTAADGGGLTGITAADAELLREHDPAAAKFLRRLVGEAALVDISAPEKWCLWIDEDADSALMDSPHVKKSAERVATHRAKSRRPEARRATASPLRFAVDRQPNSDYVALPRRQATSGRFVPAAWFAPNVVADDGVLVVSEDPVPVYGILNSRAYRLWAIALGDGRVEVGGSPTTLLTYNNFPMPQVSDDDREAIAEAVRWVWETRRRLAGDDPADWNDRATMPRPLLRAHDRLDTEVERILGLEPHESDEVVLERLLELFEDMAAALPPRRRAPSRLRSA